MLGVPGPEAVFNLAVLQKRTTYFSSNVILEGSGRATYVAERHRGSFLNMLAMASDEHGDFFENWVDGIHGRYGKWFWYEKEVS